MNSIVLWSTVAILSTLGTKSYAEFSETISNSNSSPSYKIDRCGGLSLSVASISADGGKLYNMLIDNALFFGAMSQLMYEEKHGLSRSDAQRKSYDTIAAFMAAYTDQLNRSYINSGNYLDNLTEEDMRYCSSLRKRAEE